MNFYLRDYFKLTKSGIVFFALLSAGAGYALSLYNRGAGDFDNSLLVSFPLVWLLVGLYLVVSGSFALNQAYEWRMDGLMKRTKMRPVPYGKLTVFQAFSLGIILMVLGLFILLALKPLTAGLALLAVLLYNVFLYCFLEKKMDFCGCSGRASGGFAGNDWLFRPFFPYFFNRMYLPFFYSFFMADASFLVIGFTL